MIDVDPVAGSFSRDARRERLGEPIGTAFFHRCTTAGSLFQTDCVLRKELPVPFRTASLHRLHDSNPITELAQQRRQAATDERLTNAGVRTCDEYTARHQSPVTSTMLS